jgi:hypothetical protein
MSVGIVAGRVFGYCFRGECGLDALGGMPPDGVGMVE